MENSIKPKTKTKHPERIALSPEALVRIGTWTTELGGQLKGSRITKSDLVNFLICSHSKELSEAERAQYVEKNFDEVCFVTWALKELKAAKAKGAQITLNDLLKSASQQY